MLLKNFLFEWEILDIKKNESQIFHFKHDIKHGKIYSLYTLVFEGYFPQDKSQCTRLKIDFFAQEPADN